MKKIIITTYLLIASCVALLAQIQEPVKWTFEKKDLTTTAAELIFKASIEKPWHIYGMNLPEGGPVSTNIVFENLSGVELEGAVTATQKTKESLDQNFGMLLTYYENKVDFKQKIKIKDDKKYSISGYVEYMACNDETCLAPVREPFTFKPSEQSIAAPVAIQELSVVPVVVPSSEVEDITQPQTLVNPKEAYWEPVIDLMQDSSMLSQDRGGMFWLIIFIKGFLGGLIAIFTPCVWPIIPMTVSFFLKRAVDRKKGKRDSLLYGVSIVVIYLLLGLIITAIFGANALNSLSTSAFFNLLFFTLLLIFGASFLGAFQIALPASWTTRLDKKAESTSGIWSIFLMAFTLALVSFSCTGPIIGTLLVDVSVSGSILAPAVGMFGFALALAVPFTFFAMFPALMRVMPKSGGWLNTVKVTLGFLELAFALKFLSVADLAYGWGILDREVFLVLWIVIFLMLGLYLLGRIRFAYDSEMKELSFSRLILGMISFAFAIYMIPGLWGAPLKTISAFAPPLYTQDFNLYKEEVEAEFHDYEQGMEYARKVNKPVLIDFTGYGCVNCRKMEVSVWIQPEVKKLMTENYVLITLYVDDKTALEQPYTVIENNKTYNIKTIGDKWSYLQRHKFGANAQPYYVLLDNEAKPLNRAFFFTENAHEFADFLNSGLKSYQKD